jgi:hypothetical protein
MRVLAPPGTVASHTYSAIGIPELDVPRHPRNQPSSEARREYPPFGAFPALAVKDHGVGITGRSARG